MKKMCKIFIIQLNISLKKALLLLIFGLSSFVFNAQNAKEELKEAEEFLSEASAALQDNQFSIAEADYRKAISLNPADEKGKYNLGAAYYGNNKNTEALNRFKQAASVATAKSEKHRAFHNLGNSFMNEKNYTEAVAAFKNALRNNPADDESRYNLALAKEMLEKNPPKDDKGDDEKKNKDEEKKDEDKEKENKEDKEGDDGDPKEDQDKGDEKEDKKEGEDEQDNEKPNEPKDEEEKKQPKKQKPQPGQLSPQQVKSLLEAMNNEEEKVQKKMDAQKQKGAKVKSNKDW